MTHVEDDPYAAYYEFDPVEASRGDRRAGRRPAEILHELGLAGSPCAERTWGSKVEVRCPGCERTGNVVSWDGETTVYACGDCGTEFEVRPSVSVKRPRTGR